MAKEEFFQELERAIDIANRHQRDLLRMHGVVAVGAGPERRKGKLTGKAAVIVTVHKKLSAKELKRQGIEPLPKLLDSIAVDVVEFNRPIEAAELRAAQTKAISVLEQTRAELMAQPNVTGVGVGYKMVNGHSSGEIAIRVYVEEKLSLSELQARNITAVPKTLSGIPTDVIKLPRMVPAAGPSGSRADRKDPLVGGISIGVGNRPFWRGTLGAVVFDRTTGTQRVLSNEHVLDGAIDENVIQPAPVGLDDSIEVGFQLDICNPTHFFRLDTPNTTLGTIFAGAAVAAALAAALSDEIDPTRRGQEATLPPPGALTVAEGHSVQIKYPELPVPGTPFKLDTAWNYVRQTTHGDLSHAVAETRENEHILEYKALFTDRLLYHPSDVVRLFALIVPGDKKKERACDAFHCVALLTPTKVDRLFPIVLREVGRDRDVFIRRLLNFLEEVQDKRYEEVTKYIERACLYTGQITVQQGIPFGPWNHYLYVQTTNNVPDGVKPEEAAQTIGGLPVSQNTRPTLDVACGPVVVEDGTFDIELI